MKRVVLSRRCLTRRESELPKRRKLVDEGVRQVERMGGGADEDAAAAARRALPLEEDDSRCVVCNKICYLSMVTI